MRLRERRSFTLLNFDRDLDTGTAKLAATWGSLHMRYLYPGIVLAAVIGLLAVLWSRPPGSVNPPNEIPSTARSNEPSPLPRQSTAPPAQTAANTPAPAASSPASAPASTPAQPTPTAPSHEAPMQHAGAPMHPASASAPNPQRAGTSTPATPTSPTQPVQQAATSAPGNEHGDASAGRQAFRKCQACHSLEPGKNLVGPSLAGIMGKKSGSDANFNYSPPMKQAGITWTPQTLDQYLADPQKAVPGNRMPFPGLKSEHDRA